MSNLKTNEFSARKELKDTSYELFILLVSFLSLFNIIILIIPKIDPILKNVVFIIDIFLSIIFLIDFLYRFFTAESKIDYFFKKWGWADLLASIPVQQLKLFRVFRIIRVFRLTRQFGLKNLLNEVRNNRAGSSLYMIIFLVILVLEFAGTGVVIVERGVDGANIKSASDAVWWGFATITTVGYGDHYPVSNIGRFVGTIVMMVGVGLFGVLTGFLANVFLAEDDQPNATSNTDDPQTQIAKFRQLLQEQEQMNIALRTQLSEIEKLLEIASPVEG